MSVTPAVAAEAEPAGAYIVVLHDGAADARSTAREHGRSGVQVEHVYTHTVKGYSARMSATAAARIAADPRVAYVEVDGLVTKAVSGTQSGATWGLDRIDQRPLPLDSTFSYSATGAAVTAYVIDTGVSAHTDFSGRLQSGYDFVDDDTDSSDCDGHGTHVAGTIGSETYGVAKDVTLVGVRVLDCNGSGYWSDVIAGMDWVTAQHVAGTPAVANMSLGGSASDAVDDAVERSIADGVTYAVAAGNGDRSGKAIDACTRSPARVPEALTVSATNNTDTKASWANYGTCVDLFAPGVAITSTVMSGGTETWSGTSMATPHVAGVAALYLEGVPSATPADVASVVNGQATPDAVIGAGTGSPNRLLYSSVSSGGTSPTNQAPVVSISSPASGSTVSGTEVDVTATASDSDGLVSKVEFFVDASSVPFASDSTSSDGWGGSWDSTTVSDGAHTLRAVATDDGGATATTSVSVTVANSTSTSTVTLVSAVGYKVKGQQKVDLTWSGATTTNVDIYRNGAVLLTTGNDGAETDHINRKGGGSYTYYVCEAGSTTVCSNSKTVTF